MRWPLLARLSGVRNGAGVDFDFPWTPVRNGAGVDFDFPWTPVGAGLAETALSIGSRKFARYSKTSFLNSQKAEGALLP